MLRVDLNQEESNRVREEYRIRPHHSALLAQVKGALTLPVA